MDSYTLRILLLGSWAFNVPNMERLQAPEMWIYRRMLRILWTDRVGNDRVLHGLRKIGNC